MDALVLHHDGTFEGLLTAVACAVKSQKTIHGIYNQHQHNPNLFDTVVQVTTDSEQAVRLFDYLQGLKGKAGRYAIDGYLSEEPDVGMHLYQMVRECLLFGGKATQRFTSEPIRYLHAVSHRVHLEAHRYTGLLRFRILEDGLQYAPFEANHMIIGYLAEHFKKRFRSRRWILHDVRRDFALYWDGTAVQAVHIDEAFTGHVRQHGEVPQDQLHEDERYYQDLWQRFHGAIAIANRKNLRLQGQFMPKRYWKYLVERR